MATPVSKITGIATGDVLADGSVPFTGAISGTTAAFSGSSLNVNGTGATITFNSATINRNGGTGITTLASGASGHTVKLSMAATEVLSAGSAGVGIASGFPIYWSSTSASDGAGNLFLYARAANVLAQYNSTNAQQYELYNTRTDASNYERGFMRWASNVLEIGCEAAGTGTTRSTKLLRLKGTTGAGSAALGANSPATTNTAPYTWVEITSSDGSTCYVPAFK